MIKIRLVKKNDYKNLKFLFLKNSMNIMKKINWLNLWNNPYLKKKKELGYVLTKENKIIAHLGFYPCKYSLNKFNYNSLVLHGLVVNSDYRAASIPLIKKFFLNQKSDFLISTTTSEIAAKVLKFFGMKKISIKNLNESRIIILDFFKFATFIFKKKQNFFKKIIFLLVYYFLHLIKIYTNKDHTTTAYKINRFNSKYDDFWKEYKKKSKFFNLDRNKSYQNWFFSKNINLNAAWIFIIEKNNKIVGYSSANIKKRNNFRIAYLTDLIALNEDENVLKDLVSANIQEVKKKNCIYFELANSSFVKYKIFQSLGGLPIKWKKNGFYYKSNNTILSSCLKTNLSWAPSSLDGDIAI